MNYRAGSDGTLHREALTKSWWTAPTLCLPTAQEKQRNVGIVIVHRAQEPVSDKSKHLSHSRSFSNREALRES